MLAQHTRGYLGLLAFNLSLLLSLTDLVQVTRRVVAMTLSCLLRGSGILQFLAVFQEEEDQGNVWVLH